MHSGWTFDVPELLAEPVELYRSLRWGWTASEVPRWPEVQSTIEHLVARHTEHGSLVIRHEPFLWKAVVP